MTPYSRFRMISNVVTTALVVGAVLAVWPTASGMIATATGGLTPFYWAVTGVVGVMTLITSLTVSGAIFPFLFHWGPLRRMVLGQHYLEGLWIQAEHDDENGRRLSVIQVKPQGYGYAFSGESFDQDLKVMSQAPHEMMRSGPLDISYAYSTLPGSCGERSDTGKVYLSFRPFRGRARTYTGHGQSDLMRNRFRIEGVKVRKWKELRHLQKRDLRDAVLAAYWEKLFNETLTLPEAITSAPEAAETFDPPAIRRPVIVETSRAAFVERRGKGAAQEEGPIVQRRRASDWRSEDTTPTADRIRARMMAGLPEDEEDLEDETALDAAVDETLAEEDYDGEDAAVEDSEEEFYEDDIEAEEPEEFTAEDDDAEDEEDAFEASAEEDFGDEPGDAAGDEPVLIRNRYARR